MKNTPIPWVLYISPVLVYFEWSRYEQSILGGYFLMSKQDGLWVIEQAYEWIT